MDHATLVARHAQRYGGKTAVVFGARRWSFADVNRRANAIAHGLLELGIKTGDRVATLSRNRPQHIEILFGKSKIAAVDVALNSRLSPEEIVWQLNDCGATALFAGAEQWRRIAPHRGDLETVRDVIVLDGAVSETIAYEEFVGGHRTTDVRLPGDARAPGRIFYTGGITGGLNVYPQEVEQVLYQHPAVFEASVFGVPDARWGETVKAAVVLKPAATADADELMDFCRARLASYKKPTTVDFHAELPKSDTGKILRRALQEPYWKGRDRRIH